MATSIKPAAPNKRRQHIEHSQQTILVMRVRTFLPNVICMAVPNGTAVTAPQRMRLLHEGMLPGAPDLLLFAPERPVLAVEMKTETGTVLEAQKRTHEALKACAVQVHVCRSADAAWDVVKKWEAG